MSFVLRSYQTNYHFPSLPPPPLLSSLSVCPLFLIYLIPFMYVYSTKFINEKKIIDS